MCMVCAAVPVAAAAGTSLDNKQRKQAQVQGVTPRRLRPYKVLTLIVILFLVTASVIIHTRYGWFWV